MRWRTHQCSLRGAQMRSTARPSAQWTLILAHVQHCKTLGKHENNENLFELNVYFVCTLTIFYTHSDNSQSLLRTLCSLSLKIFMLTKTTFAQCGSFLRRNTLFCALQVCVRSMWSKMPAGYGACSFTRRSQELRWVEENKHKSLFANWRFCQNLVRSAMVLSVFFAASVVTRVYCPRTTFIPPRLTRTRQRASPNNRRSHPWPSTRKGAGWDWALWLRRWDEPFATRLSPRYTVTDLNLLYQLFPGARPSNDGHLHSFHRQRRRCRPGKRFKLVLKLCKKENWAEVHRCVMVTRGLFPACF